MDIHRCTGSDSAFVDITRIHSGYHWELQYGELNCQFLIINYCPFCGINLLEVASE